MLAKCLGVRGEPPSSKKKKSPSPIHVVLKPLFTLYLVIAGRRSFVYLVFQGAVLPLSLFTDDDQVQVVVASAVARKAVHMNHISEEVQFTPGEWIGR